MSAQGDQRHPEDVLNQSAGQRVTEVPVAGGSTARPAGRWPLFPLEAAMWEQVGRLYDHHGDVPSEIRLLKLTEEVGEAAEALIGMQGMKSRKGTCRSRDDLLAELADVIITRSGRDERHRRLPQARPGAHR
jgi:hypothetical protein